jgi:hypothetical protein
MNLDKRTSILVAAVMLGVATLGLSPGQAAYAAGPNPRQAIRIAAIDPNAGGAPEDPGSTSERGKRKPKRPVDNTIYCKDILPNGHIDFYLEGDTLPSNGHTLLCTDHGWVRVSRSGDAGDADSPTTGTNAP